ncbi:MAG: glycosyltransferase family 4 protein [Sphingomonadales bacterium]|nr:glycosyltransferase family 4 protein [Sphingomonadales bacterium]
MDWMLRSLASLRADPDTPPWQLHVVGGGPEREALEQLSRTLGLDDRVVFHGFVDDLTLKGLYNLAHLFSCRRGRATACPPLRRCTITARWS